MAGRQTADIVFCMDASGSMDNAFNGVRNNVFKLIDGLKTNLQIQWDVRFDFLAYSNGSHTMRMQTLNYKGKDVLDKLYNSKLSFNSNFGASNDFFTTDVGKFKDKLSEVKCNGDEATLLALDIAADFPFRDASSCHRTVILFTDEPVDRGTCVKQTTSKVMELAKKYQDKKIALFMVTPNCDVFDTLSQIDKCEWTVDESSSLKDLDFSKFLEGIGKSVSVSQNAISAVNDVKPLYNESAWRQCCYQDNMVEVKFSDSFLNSIFQ